MHQKIEDYLADVAAGLRILPIIQRNEELREMRQHLQNAIIVNQEFGQSEEEAAKNAITQFGLTEELADQIVQSWQRGRTLDRHCRGASAFATPILLGILLYLLCSCSLLDFLWPSFEAFCNHHPDTGRKIVHGSLFSIFALTGLIVGLIFSRQAMQGVCLGLVCFALIWLGQRGWRVDIPTQPQQFMADGETIAMYLTTILSAWAASRWRNKKCVKGTSRRHLAR